MSSSSKGTDKKSKNPYSETIFLPKTSFPMRANLPKREPDIIQYWREKKAYQLSLKKQDKTKSFLLHDGPPYANGHFHVGHALNKILKDIIVKYYRFHGYYAPYVPGWDCHGLPIELAVIKKLSNKKDGSHRDPNKVRKACREYAEKFIRIQAEDQTRMGVFWDESELTQGDLPANPKTFYYTMSPHYEAGILRAFRDLFEKGLIYKGKKPIHWCPSCATALAEAEVEYNEHTSPSIYVAFPVENKENTYVVIWTTTPWTLPANLGVAFHPEFEYVIVQTIKGNFIVAKDLKDAFLEATDLAPQDIFPITQEEIKALKVRHPFLDRESKVLFGDHVTLDAGTGIVHTAPGHGQEDYIVGLQAGLEPYSPVDNYGRYTSEFPEMEGIKVQEANPKIVDWLKEKNLLLKEEKIQHSYPHCWRCHKPLIFRATAQWFLSIDPLREDALKSVSTVQWQPKWGENRFRSMVENRPDWCLSRQRLWGVPIPGFICKSCNHELLNLEILNHIIHLVDENGIEVWFHKTEKELLPENTTCPKCGSADFEKESDILDVWFDSGVSWKNVLLENEDLGFPADVYLEGSDQHRGWFQASLWPSLALTGKPPFREVITHGYVLDEKGYAMSKSLGNVISPIDDIIPKYGADVLRLWVSSEDYRTDNRIGFENLDQLADAYRKIRNTFRYLLGNLQDQKAPKEAKITQEIDKWILHRLATLSEDLIQAYETREFHLIYHKVLRFCTLDLSNGYFDIIRDRLYCEGAPSMPFTESRLSALKTLEILLQNLVIFIAPVLSFTAEEVYSLIKEESDPATVFALNWPDLSSYKNNDIDKKMQVIFEIKDEVNRELESLRQAGKIGSSTDAVAILTNDQIERCNAPKEQLSEYFVVSEVLEGESFQVIPSEKEKCPRCWLRRDLTEKGVCSRCSTYV
ncbi:MAG: isoleucine--tRNA ligase [Candidatus Hydrogenedentota bacterium]|nr:MAG: isoleucine--tRNA ligase [Candidatus Hydrogenedentota bacterium]